MKRKLFNSRLALLAVFFIFASLSFSLAEKSAKPLGDREKKQHLKQHYKLALEAYARRDFVSAINHWNEILGIDEGQESAKDMIEKVKEEKTQFNQKKEKELADLTKKERYAEARDVARILAANDPENEAYKKQLEKLTELAKSAAAAPSPAPTPETKTTGTPIPAPTLKAQKEQAPCPPPQSCPQVRATLPSDCVELVVERDGKKETIGCYYLDPSRKDKDSPSLLIYLRGWHPALGKSVPHNKRLESSRLDFKRYALYAVAQNNNLALLVTGSSDLSVLPEDITQLEGKLKVKFNQLYLAAHAGGYQGLKETLSNLKKVDRLILLDSFYFGSTLSKTIQEWTNNGTSCAGFYTQHNKSRYEKVFKKSASKCLIEFHAETYPRGHNESVATCLGSYLVSSQCPF